ncbi:hypothetical protein [Rhizobium leguminosarum]|uniref:Uncharacterized protein n=2 Tax=Rhizobium leguminosarum TaxID=384 RepID=A0A7X0DQJ6_RHILE|nr:hypothetical protein [Rhizobium leguminosarum]MBB6219493.1 hypothetical protein [Rhizobium leguminosarum]
MRRPRSCPLTLTEAESLWNVPSLMAIHGKIQREGDVVHLVAQQLFDLSGDLSGLAVGQFDERRPHPVMFPPASTAAEAAMAKASSIAS